MNEPSRDTPDTLRDAFDLPPDVIYLDGNSLGPLTHAARERLQGVVEREWGRGLIRSWNEAGWVDLPRRTGDRIGRLIGAQPGETIVADSTSINLYKLLAAACRLRPGRHTILTEAGNFPTDLYVAEGLIRDLGAPWRLARVPADQLNAVLDEDTAVLLLSHVDYRSGAMHDLPALTRAAHDAGALVLWDLAHSAGATPLALAADDVDFAVGCGYKFLNGGPGAPAFAYAAQRWHAQLQSPLCGWFGHMRPFDFADEYAPAPDIGRLQVGTPPILGLSALDAALDVALRVPPSELRARADALFERFAARLDSDLAGHGFELITPRRAAARGSQLSLRHPSAWPICNALIARGVIGDFRRPDILRFGLTPLYTRPADIEAAADTLAAIMRGGDWDRPEYHATKTVT